jgi:two-component system, LytTR family, response regulator
MIKAIALDDEPLALNVLERFCEGCEQVDLLKTFTRPDEALRYLKKFPVDLIFLDIQMPSVSGITFVEELDSSTLIIFTTAYSQYAVEGFNLDAVDFLLKPFSKERFDKTIEKVTRQRQILLNSGQRQSDFLFLRADYSLIKIKISEILYIEGLDDYLKIYLPNQRPVVARFTMKGILKKLPTNHFVRVHRSFIIPFDKIRSVQKKSVDIGERVIPIGLSYQKTFFERVKK